MILATNVVRADTLADAAEIELVAYEPAALGTFIREWCHPLDPAANEPSLFSTRLTVVGKLVRKVSPGRSYVDVVTKGAFTHALASHKRLLKRLHLPLATLTRQFTAAVSVHGPGAVILPIAILK